MNWIDLSQDKDRWRALVKAVINIYSIYYQLLAQCFYLLLTIAPMCFGHRSQPS